MAQTAQPAAGSQPEPPRTAGPAVLGVLRRLLLALAGILVFVLALELLKRGVSGYGRTIIEWLAVESAANALGFGWLLAYLFLSGSPVAAVAITFFAGGVINELQTFTMITGSRLGASFIVLFVGFLYALRGQRRAASVSIGVLALLTTAAIYIPALIPGIWLLESGLLSSWQLQAESPLASVLDLAVDPIAAAVVRLLPEWSLLFVGVAVLLAAFQLLDRALPQLSAEQSGFGRIGQLVYRPLAMFVLGGLITSVTLSVSVSLSLLVPLAARGLVRRENTLPYIMGANITTFIDTLIAAFITGGPAAFTIVLVELISVAALSILVLLFFYRPFARTLLHTQEWIVSRRVRLVIFLAIMLVVPILLLLVRW
jgi:sodium-dependent phosphate cotransporter